MQPIIFDHVKKTVITVGTDQQSVKLYQDLVDAQRAVPVAASTPKS